MALQNNRQIPLATFFAMISTAVVKPLPGAAHLHGFAKWETT
jgi:hypothetical protein